MSSYKYTDEELLEHLKLILLEYGEDLSAEAYDSLPLEDKISRRTYYNRFGSWREACLLALRSDGNIRHEYLVDQNNRLFRELEKSRRINRVFVENCLSAMSKISFKPAKVPQKERKNKVNLSFHAMRSDAHVGERVDKLWVQGLGAYNVDIYKERLWKWVNTVIKFRDEDKTGLGLNKLVIHYLGDQVGGEQVYRGQPFYLDLSLTDQLFLSVQEETNAILTLAEHFPEIEIFCVLGNHGRPGRKGDNHYRTNFDYIFYRSIQQVLQRQKNISVYVSECPTMIVKHGDFVFLLNHGDSITRYKSIPYYGIERMIRRLPDLYGMLIDYQLIAHFHEPANLNSRVYINGSLVGGSDLSINKMGLTNIPSQKIFYFHDKYGINRESDLYLADPIELTPDENNIYTPHV